MSFSPRAAALLDQQDLSDDELRALRKLVTPSSKSGDRERLRTRAVQSARQQHAGVGADARHRAIRQTSPAAREDRSERRRRTAVAPASIGAQASLVHQRMHRGGVTPFSTKARVFVGTLAGALVVGPVAARWVRAQETVLATTASPQEPSDDSVPLCKTELRLSGAVYNSRHPERSFALVQPRKNEPAGVVRVGSSLGGFQLLAIEPRGVLLRSADGECWLRLVGDPGARAAAAAPPRHGKAKRAHKAKKKKSQVLVVGHR
jgi:hypothetical protein